MLSRWSENNYATHPREKRGEGGGQRDVAGDIYYRLATGRCPGTSMRIAIARRGEEGSAELTKSACSRRCNEEITSNWDNGASFPGAAARAETPSGRTNAILAPVRLSLSLSLSNACLFALRHSRRCRATFQVERLAQIKRGFRRKRAKQLGNYIPPRLKLISAG